MLLQIPGCEITLGPSEQTVEACSIVRDPPTPPPPALPPPNPTPAPSVSCRVSYAIVTQWNTGFQANIVITNQASAPVAGYTLSWDFAAGETINSGWNANFSQTGSSAAASNPANNWNGTIDADGGSVAFGFIGNGIGRVPARFTLNNNVVNCSYVFDASRRTASSRAGSTVKRSISAAS
jgi:cellulase/cellobiase CelA1